MLGIINLLLAISEDSATLRSDMSAVYGVWQESDVVSIALFFVAPSQSLSWKTKGNTAQKKVPNTAECDIIKSWINK